MPTEQAVQAKIIRWLEAEGFWVVKVITANKRGVPDILACAPDGRFWAIEVKAPGKMSGLTKLQEYQINQINQNGGLAFAADNLATVKSRREDNECSD